MQRTAVLGALLALTACANTDPYLKPARWQPTGANAVNLARMVTRPTDLIRGRSDAGTIGVEATPPVARLWSGSSCASACSCSGAWPGPIPRPAGIAQRLPQAAG